jgi:hypothetical protein
VKKLYRIVFSFPIMFVQILRYDGKNNRMQNININV